jgi:hypothetical protein
MRADLMPTTREGKLARVLEECGEVVQAYGKLLRFGETATDYKTQKHYDNRADLIEEMRQLQQALNEYFNG